MTTPSLDDRHREEIDRLRVQNRRYRELIQNLSSVVEILRHRLESLQPSSPEHHAFEQIDGDKGPPPVVRRHASGVARVLRTVFGPTQQNSHDDLNPLTPKPGWKCLAVDQPQIRIGFTLLGMTPEAVEEAVQEVERRQIRNRDFTPVFVTDSSDLGPFRARGYVVEYLPASVTSGARLSRNDRRYLRDRIELITAKWGLGKVVDLGNSRS